jgi:hypothetical protein
MRNDISFSVVAADLAAGFQIHLRGMGQERASVLAAVKQPCASLPRAHRATATPRRHREGSSHYQEEIHQMISLKSRTRLGLTAVLTAVLTGAVVHANAAGSVSRSEALLSGSTSEPAYNDLDGMCKPPSDIAMCAEWHRVIRRNFAPREIGMLFGTATSYPQYATSYSRVKERYDRLRNEFAVNYSPASAVASN